MNLLVDVILRHTPVMGPLRNSELQIRSNIPGDVEQVRRNFKDDACAFASPPNESKLALGMGRGDAEQYQPPHQGIGQSLGLNKERFVELATEANHPQITLPGQHDPVVGILANFQAIPNEYRADMFRDFRATAEAEDFRGLLDTISDWAATAELYASPSLAAEIQEAIGGRQEVGDWLHG